MNHIQNDKNEYDTSMEKLERTLELLQEVIEVDETMTLEFNKMTENQQCENNHFITCFNTSDIATRFSSFCGESYMSGNIKDMNSNFTHRNKTIVPFKSDKLMYVGTWKTTSGQNNSEKGDVNQLNIVVPIENCEKNIMCDMSRSDVDMEGWCEMNKIDVLKYFGFLIDFAEHFFESGEVNYKVRYNTLLSKIDTIFYCKERSGNLEIVFEPGFPTDEWPESMWDSENENTC